MGHAWPLLTLERATYELAAGRNIDVYLRAAEGFATGVGLFPSRSGMRPTFPKQHMFFGKATGAAIPLMWAHAEYVKLLRSVVDNKIFDRIDPVAERYCNDQAAAGNRSMEDESSGAAGSGRSSAAHTGVVAVRAALER